MDVTITDVGGTARTHTLDDVLKAANFGSTASTFFGLKGITYALSHASFDQTIGVRPWLGGASVSKTLRALILGAMGGNYTSNVGVLFLSGVQYDISLSAGITSSVTAIAFGDVVKDTTSVVSFVVSGKNLAGNLKVQRTGAVFTVGETEGGAYAANITLVADEHGNVAETTVYAKFSPVAEVASAGSFAVTDTGDDASAPAVAVALSGTGIAA